MCRPARPPPGSATGGSYKCAACCRQGFGLRICSGCMCVRFCDEVCQKAVYRQHRIVCDYLSAPTNFRFMYPWHRQRLPRDVPAIPFGLCRAAQSASNAVYRQVELSGKRVAERCDEGEVEASEAVLQALQRLPPHSQGRVKKKLLRNARFLFTNDAYYHGVSLTDGCGCIDSVVFEALSS